MVFELNLTYNLSFLAKQKSLYFNFKKGFLKSALFPMFDVDLFSIEKLLQSYPSEGFFFNKKKPRTTFRRCGVFIFTKCEKL